MNNESKIDGCDCCYVNPCQTCYDKLMFSESEHRTKQESFLVEIVKELDDLDFWRVFDYADSLRGKYVISFDENGNRVITIGNYNPNWKKQNV